jgi:hypothetical protein
MEAQHLLAHGPASTDPLRELVPIPPGIDPRVVGAAVRELSERGLIQSIGRRKFRRPAAHARKIDLWVITDADAGGLWLLTHPEPTEPAAAVVPGV